MNLIKIYQTFVPHLLPCWWKFPWWLWTHDNRLPVNSFAVPHTVSLDHRLWKLIKKGEWCFVTMGVWLLKMLFFSQIFETFLYWRNKTTKNHNILTCFIPFSAISSSAFCSSSRFCCRILSASSLCSKSWILVDRLWVKMPRKTTLLFNAICLEIWIQNI